MEQEKNVCCGGNKCKKVNGSCAQGAVYCLGFVGSLFYMIQNAETFWMGVVGFFKAIVWPAFLVYKLFEFLAF